MTKQMTPPLRSAIAFHEAGHAIIGRHLGLVVTAATIVPAPDSLGKVCFAPCGTAMDAWRCIIAHGVSSLAGPAAQRRAALWSLAETSPKADVGFGKICGLMLGSSDTARKALMTFFEEEAAALVDIHWWAIEKFADDLLQHSTLEGDTLDEAFAAIDHIQNQIDEGVRQARAAANEGVAA